MLQLVKSVDEKRPQVGVRWMVVALLAAAVVLAGCRAAVDTTPSFGTTTSDQTYVTGIAIAPLVLPAASGGEGALSYELTGNLPAGLSFNADTRTLTGTPTAAGTYAMTYRVEDADGDGATLRFRILVVPNTVPNFGTHAIADQHYVTGTAITALVLPEATGGNGPLSYLLTGEVPAGLSFDTATRSLSGTPTAAGTWEVAYQATDTDEDTATLAFAITVEIDTAPAFASQEVLQYSYIAGHGIGTLMLPEATGGNGGLSYTLIGNVPAGLSFDSAIHALVGTPSKGTAASPISFPKVYEMGLQVTDSDLNEATGDTATLAITIELVRRIYWSNRDAAGGLQRGNFDGSGSVDIYDGGYVGGVALDVPAGMVYWSTGDTIKRANRDGVGDTEELVVGLSEALDIALDLAGDRMYWADLGTGKIQRASLDGSGVEDLVDMQEEPFGIALDVMAGKIYWADTGADIQRANLDGSDVEKVVTVLASPTGLALDTTTGKMYWTDAGTRKIQRANLDGTNIEDLVTTGLVSVQWIVVDEAERRMYWGDYGVGSIRYANLDGSNVADLITGFDNIQGFAIE